MLHLALQNPPEILEGRKKEKGDGRKEGRKKVMEGRK